ncbi:Neuropeptide Ff Receptor 2 [Manis pentadactyla]|nr:Neuropeptide Ff Receptor 2 [Manis pentadactyla]
MKTIGMAVRGERTPATSPPLHAGGLTFSRGNHGEVTSLFPGLVGQSGEGLHSHCRMLGGCHCRRSFAMIPAATPQLQREFILYNIEKLSMWDMWSSEATRTFFEDVTDFKKFLIVFFFGLLLYPFWKLIIDNDF